MSVFSKIRYGVLLPLLLWFLLSGSFFFSCSTDGGSDSGHQDNFVPVALNNYLVTSVNSSLQAFLQATDRNGDALRYSIVTNPSLGYLQYFNPNTGEFIYLSSTPGQDSFTFIASDYRSSSNIATVSITVNRTALAWEPTTETPAQPLQQNTAGSESGLLAIDPFNPNRQLAYAQDKGLRLSLDGGQSWTVVDISAFYPGGGSVAAIAFNPSVADLVYLGINLQNGKHRLLRSTDGGDTWRLIGESKDRSLTTLRSGPLQADGSVTLYARLDNSDQWFRAVDYPY